ncbi:hypothetical protein V8E54_004255 [Elaphomyces granulatus]
MAVQDFPHVVQHFAPAQTGPTPAPEPPAKATPRSLKRFRSVTGSPSSPSPTKRTRMPSPDLETVTEKVAETVETETVPETPAGKQMSVEASVFPEDIDEEDDEWVLQDRKHRCQLQPPHGY